MMLINLNNIKLKFISYKSHCPCNKCVSKLKFDAHFNLDRSDQYFKATLSALQMKQVP